MHHSSGIYEMYFDAQAAISSPLKTDLLMVEACWQALLPVALLLPAQRPVGWGHRALWCQQPH
jgi:hypothetical protein